MINELYLKTLDKYSKRFEKINIDFIGLNIMQNGSIEFKIYPAPNDDVNIKSEKSGIEKFLLKNNLWRCKCFAYSLSGERSYISIKNKSNENMVKLFEKLSNHYSFMGKYIDEIKKISLMNVSDDSKQCFSSLHMIGEKSIINDRHIVNIEWITRKMPNPNYPSFGYKYDDMYYFNYLDSLKIKSISYLCNFVRNYLFNYIANGKLHIWLAATDYYSSEKKKYKIYFKIDKNEDFNLGKLELLFINKEIFDELNSFCLKHNNLYLYGFALGCDTENNWSINCYFIRNEQNRLILE